MIDRQHTLMNYRLKQLRWLAVIVAGFGLTSCRTGEQPLPALEPAKKVLLMHYLPWYVTPAVRGTWGSHWTGPDSQHNPAQISTNGLPDIWSHYHPLIGVYDSSDPDVLECHLLQMKLAGIDGVIADWYGISNSADYPQIHKATCALFDGTGRYGMKFAACFEDRSIELTVNRGKLQPEQVTDFLSQTLRWLQAEWFTKPQYFRLHGRPLFLNWGPTYIRDAAIWSAAFQGLPTRPAFYGLHHLWKNAGADGGFTWIHHDPWDGIPTKETIQKRIREAFTYFSTNTAKVIVSAYPGFNDVYAKHLRPLDYRGSDTLRETLEVGMAGPWPLIQFATWNDYGEGTMIEPTHEFGYTFLEIIQQARQKELGRSFAFTAADLRLPARLYALRKNRAISATMLDRIAQLLNEGACQKARHELDKSERM